jgi:hypothetical protein
MAHYGANAAYGKSIYKDIAQVPTTIVVTPNPADVANGAQQQFTAEAYDQFGSVMPTQPTFTWSDNGGGIIDPVTGLFTAQTTGEGAYLVTAAVNIPRTGGSGLQVSVAINGAGNVITILSIDNAGSLYAIGDTVAILGGTAYATAQVLTVDPSGAVLTLSLLTGGSGYVNPATTHLTTVDLVIVPTVVSGSATVNIEQITPIVCNDGTIIEPTTALDIIKRTLRLLCVLATGEDPDGPETADCLRELNWMIQSWTNEKLMTWYIKNELFNLQVGKGTYTIGPDPSQDFNTTLPTKISSAFVRDTTSGYANDYKLDTIPNDRYQEIFQKGILTTYPRWINFVRSYPYGVINLWPVPNKPLVISISQWAQFVQFTDPVSIVCLPPGYKDALAYNLAVEMCPEYGVQLNPVIEAKARSSKARLKNTNFEPVLMSTDAAVLPRRAFNLLSGLYST